MTPADRPAVVAVAEVTAESQSEHTDTRGMMDKVLVLKSLDIRVWKRLASAAAAGIPLPFGKEHLCR